MVQQVLLQIQNNDDNNVSIFLPFTVNTNLSSAFNFQKFHK